MVSCQPCAKRKLRNLTDEEVLALRILKQNKDTVTSRTEKGNAIVVMNKNDYVSRAQTIPNNNQQENGIGM